MKSKIEIKAMKFELDKQTYETKVEHLRRLKETLVHFAFVEIAHHAIGFEELWHKEMFRNYEILEKSDLSEEKKNELRCLIMPICPSKEELEEKKNSGLSTEEWSLKKDIEFIDKQISIAEHLLAELPHDIKMKIVEENITKRYFWHDSISAYCKIDKAIRENKVPKKKVNHGKKKNNP